MRFLPKLLESNRINKTSLTLLHKHRKQTRKIFGKLVKSPNFCMIYKSYGTVSYSNGLRRHRWRVQTTGKGYTVFTFDTQSKQNFT